MMPSDQTSACGPLYLLPLIISIYYSHEQRWCIFHQRIDCTRGGVSGAAAICVEHIVASEISREAKVDDLGIFCCRQQDVLQLQISVLCFIKYHLNRTALKEIPMDKVLFVAIAHGIGDLAYPFSSDMFFEWTFLEQVVKELATRAELHDHKDLFFCHNHFVQLRHMRMGQVAPCLDFPHKGRVVDTVDNLDGDRDTCRPMQGFLHFAIRALANRGAERVAANISHLARLDLPNDLVLIFLLMYKTLQPLESYNARPFTFCCFLVLLWDELGRA